MPRKKAVSESLSSKPVPSKRPMSPEARENELIALAYDLAEKQIREGTASAQVIAHFIKQGSKKSRLEGRILEKQEKLVTAKTESLESAKRDEEFHQKVLDAMRKYSGHQDDPDDDLY